MFTGLVEASGTVVQVRRAGDVTAFRICCSFADELKRGESVSVLGVCTTVVDCGPGFFDIQLTEETMRVSRFSLVMTGDRVNLERALPANGRLDGHLVAGHVDGTGVVMSMKKGPTAAELWIHLSADLMRYVVYKGSICVDGVSLTIASVQGNSFSVAVIPETLSHTTLGTLRAGQKVNIETDMIARYVEKLLGMGEDHTRSDSSSGLTMERLAQMGW